MFLQLSRWPPLPPLPGCSAAYCVAVDGGPGLSDVTPGTNSQVHPQSSKWRTSHQIPGGNRSISGPYQVTPGGTRPPLITPCTRHPRCPTSPTHIFGRVSPSSGVSNVQDHSCICWLCLHTTTMKTIALYLGVNNAVFYPR